MLSLHIWYLHKGLAVDPDQPDTILFGSSRARTHAKPPSQGMLLCSCWYSITSTLQPYEAPCCHYWFWYRFRSLFHCSLVLFLYSYSRPSTYLISSHWRHHTARTLVECFVHSAHALRLCQIYFPWFCQVQHRTRRYWFMPHWSLYYPDSRRCIGFPSKTCSSFSAVLIIF